MAGRDDPCPLAMARMRNIDGLPIEYRTLVHRYGPAVWKAYINGWSPEKIEATATADGCFSTKRAMKRNSMGVPRSLFIKDPS